MATLQLVEDHRYFFDPEAADKPVRFIEKFCRHFEGRFAGQPFTLLDWQRELVRNLFGWKRRQDDLRRFRELYLLTGKGAGKTPLLAAIGLYTLLGDGEAGPHVVSMASSFEQAALTFDFAKKFIIECPDLSRHAIPQQYRISVPRKHGKWTVASGKPTGRSGSRPNCIIASEIHEWAGATVESFNLLTSNLFKRAQPLLLLDTNAGTSRSSFAYQLHERALKVLNGNSADETLLPVIYEAPAAFDWTTEAAAAAANPSLGTIITFDQLRPALSRAMVDDSAEAEYRRLYLSQWTTDGKKKWIDMTAWDACTKPLDIPKDAALYVGVDLSQGDDLCAVVYVWVTPEKFHAQSHFWVPKATASRYETREAVPYSRWAGEGAITLIDEATISTAVKQRIAAHILETHRGGHKIKAVCYDTYRADDAIAALEGAGITCVPVRQGFTLTPGCQELERRLKEGSIAIDANAVMRFCAENVEVKTDDRGNFWPAKPNAKGKYAGKRGAKIDGIAALVTALTEARKHSFPAVKKQWSGRAFTI